MSAATATPARKTAPKQRRPLVLSADVLRVGALTVLLVKSPGKRQGDVDATAYVVRRLNPAEGEAFRLHKLTAGGEGTGDAYDVLLSADAVSCDCRGFTAHSRCKHAAAVRDKAALGEL